MEIYYDLHIHTALSPCGDDDMTPNNIVNMALLNELDVIAITDHNCCKNVRAVMDVAKESGLLVIPGMEVETSEEVHVICLFAEVSDCERCADVVWQSMQDIKNKPKIFGHQTVLDENDEPVSECERLLITASGLPIYELVELVKGMGGVCIPAHIDKHSNSVIANLGFIPEDLKVGVVEFTKNADCKEFFNQNKRLFAREYYPVRSSDAHYLHDIAERRDCLIFDTKPTAHEFIQRLKSL